MNVIYESVVTIWMEGAGQGLYQLETIRNPVIGSNAMPCL